MESRRASAAIVAFATAMRPSRAHAEAPETPPPSIWYRSGEGCPDGPAFLKKLETRGVHARLAVVGDPIDFVVTLGAETEGARGLLERQTQTGTVAIRRLDGGTCDEIAEGLALSLSLADAPETRRREEPAPPATAAAGSTAIAPEPERPERDTEVAARGPHATKKSGARVAVGVGGGVASGVIPTLLPGASIFFDLGAASLGALPRASLRVGAFGYTSGASSDGSDYRVWLAGGRLEACPVWLGVPAFRIHPCAAIDLGTIQTSGSGPSADTAGAFWATGRFGLRLEVPVGARFGLETAVAARFPFTRYDIVAGAPERVLYRTAAAGIDAGLGAYFVLQ